MKNNKITEQNKRNKHKNISFLIFLFIVGFLIGFYVNDVRQKPNKNDFPVEEKQLSYSSIREGGFKFINPLLDCDNFEASNSRMYVDLKNNIKEYINLAISHKRVEHISLYYRHLNNGPWIGFNETHQFTPASLMKVAIIIGILKKAQKDPNLLKTSYYYPARFDHNFSQNIGHNQEMTPGNSYTVKQLLDYTVQYSDNEASHLLYTIIEDDFEKILKDMGVDLSNKDITTDFITVREYSTFFRILYNASYLDREMSETALELLSRGSFNDGIPAKLPNGTQVAHKFGERAYTDSNLKQLHDCGIVYKEGNPYLICIMTKGTNFDELIKVIADLSEIVYNYH